jgi:hypothetical protein
MFRVALCGGFGRTNGAPAFPIFGLTPLATTAGVEYANVDAREGVMQALDLADSDTLILLATRFDPRHLAANYSQSAKAINFAPQSAIAGEVGYALAPSNPDRATGYNMDSSADSGDAEVDYLFVQSATSPPSVSFARYMPPYSLRDTCRLAPEVVALPVAVAGRVWIIGDPSADDSRDDRSVDPSDAARGAVVAGMHQRRCRETFQRVRAPLRRRRGPVPAPERARRRAPRQAGAIDEFLAGVFGDGVIRHAEFFRLLADAELADDGIVGAKLSVAHDIGNRADRLDRDVTELAQVARLELNATARSPRGGATGPSVPTKLTSLG